jgi:hypothetical protein
MPPALIRQAIETMEKSLAKEEVEPSDEKARAKAMRAIIQELASKAGIDLKLRKKLST